MSLCTPVLEVCSVSLFSLQRSIFRLVAFWATPVRLCFVASSPCLAESRVRKGADRLEGLSSSVLFRILSFRSCEDSLEEAKAAAEKKAEEQKEKKIDEVLLQILHIFQICFRWGLQPVLPVGL